LVIDSIRHLTPGQALTQLEFINKSAALPVAKTIKQALANAVNNNHANAQDLRFAHLQVNAGSTLKRWRAVSRGRGHSVFKRTSHIKVVLKVIEHPVPAIKAKKTENKSTKTPKR
jgi:large subunit ribosomal protein L22